MNDDTQVDSVSDDVSSDTGGNDRRPSDSSRGDYRSDGGRGGRLGGGSRFGGGDRQMFAAVCTKCNKETTVPFQPTPGKPVYCRDCFMEVRQDRPPRRSFGGGGGGFRREF